MYKVLQVHEVYHYPKKSSDLFKTFIGKLNLIKTLNSNIEDQLEDEKEFDDFVAEINRDIILTGNNVDKSDFQNNPCKRNMAKLLMNSSYGRLGIRPAHNEKCFIRSRENLIKLFEDPSVTVGSLDPVCNGNILRADLQIDLEQQPALPISSVALASAITSMARIHLLKIILYANKNPKAIPLYTDTDCLFCLHHDTLKDKEFILNPGVHIGEMKNELSRGDTIKTFVSLGAKVYGYETLKGDIKLCCKGIHQSAQSENVLNVNTLERELLSTISNKQGGINGGEQRNGISIKQTQFTRSMIPEPSVGIRDIDKNIKITLTKRGHIFNLNDDLVEEIIGYKAHQHVNKNFQFYSLPYGWSSQLLKKVAEKFKYISQ